MKVRRLLFGIGGNVLSRLPTGLLAENELDDTMLEGNYLTPVLATRQEQIPDILIFGANRGAASCEVAAATATTPAK